MKKGLSILIVISFIMGSILIACQSSAEKQRSKQEMVDAKSAFSLAKQALSDMIDESILLFKNKATEQIKNNDNNLAELRELIDNSTMKSKSIHDPKYYELEQKNREMEKKLEEYMGESFKEWNTFKVEFKLEMKKLVKALIELNSELA